MRVCDRVIVTGRTMVSPTLPLTGLEAVVMPEDPSLPKGLVTIMVDWEGAGHEDASDLPRFCTVPEEHLEVAVQGKRFWPKAGEKPKLRLI